MSQSPLQRTSRRAATSSSHGPSRLAHSSSAHDLATSPTASLRRILPKKSQTSLRTESLPKSATHSGSLSSVANGTDHLDDNEDSGPSERYSTPRRSELLHIQSDNTPKRTAIHYSPYALSTPPAGLSKSSSIPFDLNASAKAAQRVRRETVLIDQGSQSGDGLGTEAGSTKRKRFIRKKSILQRVTEWPSNTIERLMLSTPTSIQELLPPERFAHPISLGIHSIHFILTAPLWNSKQSNDSILRSSGSSTGNVESRWGKWEDEQRSEGLSKRWGVMILTFVFILISTLNGLYLFSKYRTYDMQLRSAQEPPVSPHATPIKSPQSISEDPFKAREEEKKDSLALKGTKIAWTILKFVFTGAYAAIHSMLGKPYTSNVGSFGNNTIQSLRVWDPPEFCLAFFCAYPPTAPILTYLLNPSHPLITPLLHLSGALMLTYLAKCYSQLVKDRMILSAEVMREYDKRFVYKRIFGSKVDRSVQTEEAETIWQ